MLNIAIVSNAEVILFIGGFVIICCTLGFILFELFRGKRMGAETHIQKNNHTKIILRNGLSISSILVALDMILSSFAIYYHFPAFLLILITFLIIILIMLFALMFALIFASR